MATNIKSTALDFENIKTSLKEFFISKSEFADYDFEASGLNNILDVLAANTHYNGLIANFALNESFLKTAQLRSSVLSLSESLGYIPRSRSAAVAYVNISLTNTQPNRATSIALPAGTQFTTSIDDVEYTFQTITSYSATDDGAGVYRFTTSTGNLNIPVYEGEYVTKTFRITENADDVVYIIPDAKMDTATATVKVYTSYTSNSFNEFRPLSEAITIDATSRFYVLREAPNGYFQLSFGDGITTGITPQPGELVQIRYIRTNGSLANGGRSFSSTATVTVGGVSTPISVVTSVTSAGGQDKETVEQIRSNAPIAFAAQNRLVTPQDYKAIILNRYANFLDDVTAWGGEDNNPPTFGKVFIALKYVDGTPPLVRTNLENSITTNVVNNIGMLSIDPVYTSATTTYLELSTFFNFNPNLSSLTAAATENQIQRTIESYVSNNLVKFGKVFRRSLLLSTIDNISEAILNSRMDVKINQRIEPRLTANQAYIVQYPVGIAAPDDQIYRITTTPFIYDNKICILRNKLNSTTLQVVATGDNSIVTDNAGSYDPVNGKVSIINFAPTSIIGGVNYIKVSVTPANQSTIRPLRNYVIDLDTVRSVTTAQIDYQQIRANI